MATTITINSVDWANTPSAAQTCTFEYKLFSATTWTLKTSTAVINTTGLLVAPVVINGLIPGNVYYVRWHNNCDSPANFYIQQFNL